MADFESAAAVVLRDISCFPLFHPGCTVLQMTMVNQGSQLDGC